MLCMTLILEVGKFEHRLEVLLHGSGLDSPENIKKSFTVFRVSDICANVWKETQNQEGPDKQDKPSDHSFIYSHYRALMHMPDIKPWTLFALFVQSSLQVMLFQRGALQRWELLILSSIMRHEMAHEQVFANLIIGFNGPSVPEFAARSDIENRQHNCQFAS